MRANRDIGLEEKAKQGISRTSHVGTRAPVELSASEELGASMREPGKWQRAKRPFRPLRMGSVAGKPVTLGKI